MVDQDPEVEIEFSTTTLPDDGQVELTFDDVVSLVASDQFGKGRERARRIREAGLVPTQVEVAARRKRNAQ